MAPSPRRAARHAGLSRRLHGLISDIGPHSLPSDTERVIGYLFPDQDERKAQANASCAITLPTSKTVVASRRNMSPEHYFSRILHELAEAGLISVDGRAITVLDAGRRRSYRG